MTTESTPLASPSRHPLGLPPGSVRAGLALMIVSLFWVMLLFPQAKLVPVPLYLYCMLGLVLLFFGAHGHTIVPAGTDHPPPWHLPSGLIRGLIVLGTAAVVGWRYYTDRETLLAQLTPPVNELPMWPHFLLSLVGGFSAGWLSRRLFWRNSAWFQDVQAWISLLAMLGLGAEVIVQLFINPSIADSLELGISQCVLTAIVAFYFGVRS